MAFTCTYPIGADFHTRPIILVWANGWFGKTLRGWEGSPDYFPITISKVILRWKSFSGSAPCTIDAQAYLSVEDFRLVAGEQIQKAGAALV